MKRNIMNNFVRRFFLPVLIILTLLLTACAGSESLSVNDIAKELICPCGCTEVLSNCHCDTAKELTSSIESKISLRQSEEQIRQSFIDQYGARVLPN